MLARVKNQLKSIIKINCSFNLTLIELFILIEIYLFLFTLVVKDPENLRTFPFKAFTQARSLAKHYKLYFVTFLLVQVYDIYINYDKRSTKLYQNIPYLKILYLFYFPKP